MDAEFATALGDAPSDDAPVAGQVPDPGDDDSGETVGGIAIDSEPPRTVKASTRDFARKIAEAHKGKLEATDDFGLAPVIGAPQPAAPRDATPSAPSSSVPGSAAPAPKAEPAAAAPAAGPTPEVIAAWETINTERAAVAKERAAIEAQRERFAALGRGKLLGSGEEMHGALAAWLRDELGDGATDADVNEALADVVTELSLRMSGVTLPDSARVQAEQKRALREIKRHKRELERVAAEQRSKAERDEQRRQRSTTADQLGKEITAANSYAYLTAADDSDRDGLSVGEFVLEVINRRYENDRTKLTWQEAAKLANDYFKQEATKHHARWSPLLAPPPAVSAAPAQGTPQGGRSESQVPRTLTNAAASEPPAIREPESSARFDPDDHRRRTAEKWRGKIGRKE